MSCRGVDGLHGLHVVSTGWVHLAGAHIVRRDLAKVIRGAGGTFQGEFNSMTDLVILGSYLNHQIQNDREGGTDALEQLSRSRQNRWRHVHLISQDDLHRLLRGELVPCRRVHPDWATKKTQARKSIRRGHL